MSKIMSFNQGSELPSDRSRLVLVLRLSGPMSLTHVVGLGLPVKRVERSSLKEHPAPGGSCRASLVHLLGRPDGDKPLDGVCIICGTVGGWTAAVPLTGGFSQTNVPSQSTCHICRPATAQPARKGFDPLPHLKMTSFYEKSNGEARWKLLCSWMFLGGRSS